VTGCVLWALAGFGFGDPAAEGMDHFFEEGFGFEAGDGVGLWVWGVGFVVEVRGDE